MRLVVQEKKDDMEAEVPSNTFKTFFNAPEINTSFCLPARVVSILHIALDLGK